MAADGTDGLNGAWRLDGKGGAVALDWDGVTAWRPEDGPIWIELDRDHPRAREWLERHSGLTPLVSGSLVEPETRPRATAVDAGMIVHLRGVNLNPGAEPDDMVSIRIWVEAQRIVTVQLRRLLAVEDTRGLLQAGRGPTTAPGVAVRIACALAERMVPVMEEIEDQIDAAQDDALAEPSLELQARTLEQQSQAIRMRRFLAPQREALSGIAAAEAPWLLKRHREALREASNQTVRVVEQLDAVRDRAAAIQVAVQNASAVQLNRNLYLLSVVGAVVLPPTLLAGLLGMNVSGIPWSDEPWSFAAVCIGTLAIVALELLALRWMKWL
ncbi:MAG: zinc transporter ZntB [Alphaproteobacteria bacterium]